MGARAVLQAMYKPGQLCARVDAPLFDASHCHIIATGDVPAALCTAQGYVYACQVTRLTAGVRRCSRQQPMDMPIQIPTCRVSLG